MCVNVHADGPKFWSLGLVRVWGSMPSEKCIELLRCRLTAFGPNLDTDIVAIIMYRWCKRHVQSWQVTEC